MSDILSALSAQQTSALVQSVFFVVVALLLAAWMIARPTWWVSHLSQERLGRWLSESAISLTVRLTGVLLVALALLVAIAQVLSIQAVMKGS